LEDIIQSLEAIQEAYAKTLLIDQKTLKDAQLDHDVAQCQEILHDAYRTDVRPLLQRARLRNGGALHPLKTFRALGIRKKLVDERGADSVASGL
jgi:L-rhamnose isomerase/sugar isomerase